MGPYQQVAGLHSSAPCCCSTGGGGGDRGNCTPCHIRDCLAVRDGSAAFLFARGHSVARFACDALDSAGTTQISMGRIDSGASGRLLCIALRAGLLRFLFSGNGGWVVVGTSAGLLPSVRPSVRPSTRSSPSLPPSLSPSLPLSLSLSLSQDCARCGRNTRHIRVCPPPLIASCVPSSAVCSSVAPI